VSRWQNWSRSVTATPRQFDRPATEAEIETIVEEAADAGETVRVAGSGHSFSPVVPSDHRLVSLERHAGLVDVDRDAMQVTVKAGTTLSDLNRELAERGLALANLGDIDRQSVAGAFSTGTHGTGLDFGVLATQIAAIRLVTVDGKFRWIEPDDGDLFRAAQVSLGALGIITAYRIDVEPAYDLCLRRRRLPLEFVLDNLDEFHDAHRNWEFFWFPHTDEAIVKTFDEVPPGESAGADDGPNASDALDSLGARAENAAWESICRLGTRFPRTASAGSKLASWTLSEKTEVGPSHEVFANPRNVRFRETEYGVPLEEMPTVLSEIRELLSERNLPVQFPIECRFVGADEPYLSPAYGRDSGFVAVHTYYRKEIPEYFRRCEEIFAARDGRPHWGKEHSKTVEYLADQYPEWDRFQEFRRKYDPEGVFLNDHLSAVFGVE